MQLQDRKKCIYVFPTMIAYAAVLLNLTFPHAYATISSVAQKKRAIFKRGIHEEQK